MKQVNINIHPFSALVGMAVLSMVWVTTAAMPLQSSSSDRDVSAIENVNDPHPRDYVQVLSGAPYTVPAGKILVCTGARHSVLIGAATSCDGQMGISVWVDGVQRLVLYSRIYNGYQGGNSSLGGLDLPVGFSVQEGQVVDVHGVCQQAASDGGDAVLLGYLVDA